MTGTATPAPANSGAPAGDAIEPARAAAGFARWRRALASALGEDPGARFDRPDRMLTMLRIFGSTRRLAELCLKQPCAAADALVEGPSRALAEAARDIAGLNGSVAGGEALYAALAPLKMRVDIAIGVAELSGAWTTAEATAARTDFAERLVETALSGLIRGAAARGEMPARREDNTAEGVFALAGDDFGHEDLAPLGPLEVALIYDDKAFDGPAARMVERAFVRIASEFHEAFQGKSGDQPLFILKTPLGNGVRGFGFAEARSRLSSRLADPQQGCLRQWIASARVVAGDRRAGGMFLESVEEIVWGGSAARGEMRLNEGDPRAPFRAVADRFRNSLGAHRPLFRTASARVVIAKAAESGSVSADLAARLIAGEEFAQGLISRLQLMKGAADFGALRDDEAEALARLAGFADREALFAVLRGATADAANALARFAAGPLGEFERYKALDARPDDIDKLEDLGFGNGAGIGEIVDGWAGLAAGANGARFSALAPGLLTAFGETQRPDEAARIFDEIVRSRGEARDDFALLAKGGPVREGLVDALGCFGAAVAPLARSPDLAREFFEERGRETPETGAEWLARFGPPKGGLDDLAAWRKACIGRIALYAAAGDMRFGAAADALATVNARALAETFSIVTRGSKANLALHVFDGSGRGLPGCATPIGFISAGGSEDENEAAARAFLDAVEGLGGGFFAAPVDLARRPGGVGGRLAPDAAAFKAYFQSEAPAAEQVSIVRAQTLSGSEDATAASVRALKAAAAAPKRSDAHFRDLDRARAQRLRRDRSASEWDLERRDGALIDVDLIIGALIYKFAPVRPASPSLPVEEALDALVRANLVAAEAAETLKSARAFWLRLATARALARWSDPEREPARSRFAALLARAAEVDRFAMIRPIMRGYAEETNRLYAQLVLGRPHLTLSANA